MTKRKRALARVRRKAKGEAATAAAAARSGSASGVADNDRTPIRRRMNDGMLPPLGETATRLHRVILAELDALEAGRAHGRGGSKAAGEGERTARTVARLTETLKKLECLRSAASPTGLTNEDMPADIDEFRYALAQRIEEFVKSRTDACDDGGSSHKAISAAP